MAITRTMYPLGLEWVVVASANVTVLQPKEGDALIDPMRPLNVDLRYQHPWCTKSATRFKFASKMGTWTAMRVWFTPGDGDWTDPSKLSGSEDQRYQDEMATITAPGVQMVDLSGLSFAGDPTQAVVKTIQFNAYCGMDWETGSDYPQAPGDARIRFIFYYKGKPFFQSGTNQDYTRFTGAHTLAAIQRQDGYDATGQYNDFIHRFLMKVFESTRAHTLDPGPPVTYPQGLEPVMHPHSYTLADLETLGTDLQVAVIAHEGIDSYATAWYCGAMHLKIEYYLQPPRWMSAHQIQAATDAGFTTDVYDSGSQHSNVARTLIPPGSLAYGSTIYLHARCSDDETTPNVSDWSETVTFETMSEDASKMLHDPGARRVGLVELEVGRPFLAAAWSLTAVDEESVAVSNVWETSFDRSTEQLSNFWIADFEESGTKMGYEQVQTITEVEATENSFCWKEGTTNKLYIHVTGATHPAAFRPFSIVACLILPMATEAWYGGPAQVGGTVDGKGQYYFEPLVLSLPSITERLQNLDEGLPAVTASSLVLSNADGRWLKCFDLESHADTGDGFARTTWADPSAGYLWRGRSISIKMVGEHSGGRVAYADALRVFKGVVGFSRGRAVTRDQIQIDAKPAIGEMLTKKVAWRRYTEEQYPRLRSADENTTIAVVMGATAQIIVCAVVDTTNRLLRAAENASDVTSLYYDGTSFADFSFDVTTQHIRITGSTATFDANIDAEWTAYCRGPEISDYTTAYYVWSGVTARYFLENYGLILAADIVTSYFDWIDDNMQGFYDDYISAEEPVSDVLARVQASGLAYVVQRADGKFLMVPEWPSQMLSNSVVLTDADFLSAPEWVVRDDHMAAIQELVTHYSGVTTIRQDYTLPDWYGITRSSSWEAYTSTFAIELILNQSQKTVLIKDMKIQTTMKMWPCFVGCTVAVKASDVMRADGAAVYDLYQVRQRSLNMADMTMSVVLRWRRRLELWERPI